MGNIINGLSDKKPEYFKDAQGRGWALSLIELGKSCYVSECDKKAIYELCKIGAYLTRRELLCFRCFKFRKKELGLIEIKPL